VGDAYTLSLGDCLAPDGLANLADGSVDHVICDPPYGAQVYAGYRTGAGRTQATGGVHKEMGIGAVDREVASAASAQIARLARRWVVVWCDAELSHVWREELVAHGVEYVRAGVWIRRNAAPQFTGDRPGQGFEACVIGHQPGRKRWNGGGAHAVWTFPVVHGPDRHEHPCPKPLGLMEALIRDFTDPNDLVLDPFAGSGTTGVAAIRHGRRFIGWERDPKYHAVAVKRLSAAREQLSMPFEDACASGKGDDVNATSGVAEAEPEQGVRLPRQAQRRVTVLGPDGEVIT
jgi:hypothetical protein